jgi:hypothetical protein
MKNFTRRINSIFEMGTFEMTKESVNLKMDGWYKQFKDRTGKRRKKVKSLSTI